MRMQHTVQLCVGVYGTQYSGWEGVCDTQCSNIVCTPCIVCKRVTQQALCVFCLAEDLPPLVLPPIEYPGVLAPPAKEININSQIMDLYINSILSGQQGCWGAGCDQRHCLCCVVHSTA